MKWAHFRSCIIGEKSEFRRNPEAMLAVLTQSIGTLLLAGVLAVTVNLWRPAGISFQYQEPQEPPFREAPADGPWITVEEAESIFVHKKALFIDARPSDLYEREHISDAVNLPLELFDNLFEKLPKGISQKALLIVYCDGRASERSAALAGELLMRGFGNVRILRNGWDQWVAHELPIEAGAWAGE